MITLEVKYELSNEAISDLLATALEGGSNYWADHIKYKKPLNFANTKEGEEKFIHISYPMNEGGEITIRDRENKDKEYTLNLHKIRRGLKRMARGKYAFRFQNIVKEDYDAEDADIFLQFAVLGDCIYG